MSNEERRALAMELAIQLVSGMQVAMSEGPFMPSQETLNEMADGIEDYIALGMD